MDLHRQLFKLLLVLFISHTVESLSLSDFRSAISHLQESSPSDELLSLSNTRIPFVEKGKQKELLAYYTSGMNNGKKRNTNEPVVILLHEFFGLSKSICDKADALAQDLKCTVIAPDTFRGESSTFIPKCIWLALTTPQDRVNGDLDRVVEYLGNPEKLVVMGFCYGGGKAIRYTTQCKADSAATVVCYGSPVTDVEELSKLKMPVCGVFGANDFQFPMSLLDQFKDSLTEAGVENDICIYENVGHAFWSDMESVRQGVEPQSSAYNQVLSFLKKQLASR